MPKKPLIRLVIRILIPVVVGVLASSIFLFPPQVFLDLVASSR